MKCGDAAAQADVHARHVAAAEGPVASDGEGLDVAQQPLGNGRRRDVDHLVLPVALDLEGVDEVRGRQGAVADLHDADDLHRRVAEEADGELLAVEEPSTSAGLS